MVTTQDSGISAGAVVRPAWRRLRFWVGVGAVLVLAAVVFSSTNRGNSRALDPSSPSHRGSKALAVLMRHYGTPVQRTTSLATATATPAGSTVVVPAPFAYSTHQLGELARGAARLVVVRPSTAQLAALGSTLRESGPTGGPTEPRCTQPGPVAAGTVDLPVGTTRYQEPAESTTTGCYDGAVVLGPHLSVLGSAALLRNDRLVDEGVAALDINVLTDNGNTHQVVWLLPGSEATAAAAPSYWELFPEGARRAFVWLLLLGVLVVLWRGRRFGPVVSEPLPVVVRSAEVVEGHGRLYRRAGALDRAAAALRAGAVSRLATHTGLQRGAGVPELVATVAPLAGRRPEDVADLLAGPAPADDQALLTLAVRLDALEDAAGVPPRPKGTRS